MIFYSKAQRPVYRIFMMRRQRVPEGDSRLLVSRSALCASADELNPSPGKIKQVPESPLGALLASPKVLTHPETTPLRNFFLAANLTKY